MTADFPEMKRLIIEEGMSINLAAKHLGWTPDDRLWLEARYQEARDFKFWYLDHKKKNRII